MKFSILILIQPDLGGQILITLQAQILDLDIVIILKSVQIHLKSFFRSFEAMACNSPEGKSRRSLGKSCTGNLFRPFLHQNVKHLED